MVGVGVGPARVVGGDQQLVVRDDPRSAVDVIAVLDQEAGAVEQLPELRADELAEPRAPDGDAEQEEPEQQRQRVRVAEPP